MKYFLMMCALCFSANLYAESIEVEGVELVKSERVNVREYVMVYHLVIKNNASDVSDLTALVTSSDSSIVVLDDEVVFGSVAPGQSATSTDTFSFRKNRTIPFDLKALNFEFKIQ